MNPIKLYRLFKEFNQWRDDQKRYRRAYESLLSCELLPYTVLEVVYGIKGSEIPMCVRWQLFKQILNRQGRGTVTLEQAIDLYVKALRSEP